MAKRRKKNSEPAPTSASPGLADPLVQAMIAKIPRRGVWPKAAREAWLALFAQALDVAFREPEAPPAPPPQPE
jgi:hypothetical protein